MLTLAKTKRKFNTLLLVLLKDLDKQTIEAYVIYVSLFWCSTNKTKHLVPSTFLANFYSCRLAFHLSLLFLTLLTNSMLLPAQHYQAYWNIRHHYFC